MDHEELVKLSKDAFSSLSTDPTTAYDLVAKVCSRKLSKHDQQSHGTDRSDGGADVLLQLHHKHTIPRGGLLCLRHALR